MQQVVPGSCGDLFSGEPDQDPAGDTSARLTLRASWVCETVGRQYRETRALERVSACQTANPSLSATISELLSSAAILPGWVGKLCP